MPEKVKGRAAANETVGGGRCPICGEPRQPAYRPFCSKRCRNVDLGRWFNEVYAVPAVEPADDDDEAEAEGSQR